MNNPLILLDTHVLLWSLLQPKELSEEIKHKINLAQENSQLFLSSIFFMGNSYA